jgi:hypothetical protein
VPNHDRRWRLLEKQEAKRGGNERRERNKDFTSMKEIDLSFACLLDGLE